MYVIKSLKFEQKEKKGSKCKNNEIGIGIENYYIGHVKVQRCLDILIPERQVANFWNRQLTF